MKQHAQYVSTSAVGQQVHIKFYFLVSPFFYPSCLSPCLLLRRMLPLCILLEIVAFCDYFSPLRCSNPLMMLLLLCCGRSVRIWLDLLICRNQECMSLHDHT
jgi:hypothetical protein